MRKPFFSALFTLLFILTSATVSFAQSLSGTWEATITSPQGAGKSQLSLKQEGETLSGMIKSEAGEVPIKGTIKGHDVKLMFSVKFQDNDLPITLSGKLDGEALKGAADFGGFAEGEWSAVRSGGSAAAATAPAKPAAASSAALSGDWDIILNASGNEVPGKASLKQEGETVSGTIKTQLGEVPVKGTLKGADVQLKFTVNYQGTDVPITLTGKLDGGAVKGAADFGGMAQGDWTGKKGN